MGKLRLRLYLLIQLLLVVSVATLLVLQHLKGPPPSSWPAVDVVFRGYTNRTDGKIWAILTVTNNDIYEVYLHAGGNVIFQDHSPPDYVDYTVGYTNLRRGDGFVALVAAPQREGQWKAQWGVTRMTFKERGLTAAGRYRDLLPFNEQIGSGTDTGWMLAAYRTNYAGYIASLVDPATPAKVGALGAAFRVLKAVYWLKLARLDGKNLDQILEDALGAVGLRNEAAILTKEALLRNLDIAGKLGCLDAEGMAEMRKGKAPTVRRGPYKGDQLSVDHVVPRAVVPELDNVIANLELMPERMNSAKKDKVGARQMALAKKLAEAGLLSRQGLKAVERAQR